jgi:hypothetical protein
MIIFGGKHYDPQTVEKFEWTQTITAPKDHFWSDWGEYWTLIRIEFEQNYLTVPTCLFYDLDAPAETSGPNKGKHVGQVYFPDHSQIGKEGITAKVRQGHTIKVDCLTVRPKIQALQPCRTLIGGFKPCEH